MAIDPTVIVVAILGMGPGLAALAKSRNSRKEIAARVDAAAFEAAKDFYSDTLDAYKLELSETRKALRDVRIELAQSVTDREFQSMRITMLERDKNRLETIVRSLELKLTALGVTPPADDPTL